jgi:signal transduction histidine kinase
MHFPCAALLFCILFSSCSSSPRSGAGTNRSVELYAKALTYRYHNSDSLLWYGQAIDSLPETSVREDAMAKICYGMYFNHRAQYRLGEKNYSEAIALLAESPTDTLLATAKNGMGNSQKNLGEFDRAIETFHGALAIYEDQHHPNAYGVHVNMAQVYQMKEDIPNATKHLSIAIAGLNDHKDDPSYLMAAHTLANLYGMSGKYDSALAIDRACLLVCDSLHSNQLKSTFYDNMALCLLYLGEYDSSRYYFYECLRIDSLNKDYKQVADTYRNLTELATLENDPEQAEAYAYTSIGFARMTGYKMSARSCWEVLAAIYLSRDSFRLAIAAKDSAYTLARQITNEKTEEKIAELEAVYDAEKSAEQIAGQEDHIFLQRIAIGVSIFILALFALITVLYVKALRRKKETELADRMHESELRAQAAVYASEQQERARVARDLHDSVGQMLAVIRMQISTQQHDHPELKQSLEPAAALLEKTISEVRSISHNLLPEEVNLGLATALGSLRDAVNAAKNVQMELHIGDEAALRGIPQERVLNIYRIAQEVTGNMLKHSRSEKIECSVTVANGKLSMQIRDFGVGFDTVQLNGSEGIGWKNVQARVALLRGTMQLDAAHGKGTTVTVEIEL